MVLAILASIQPESAAVDGFVQALLEAKTGEDVVYILSQASETLQSEGMIRHSNWLSQARPKDWQIPFRIAIALIEQKNFAQTEATLLGAQKLLSRSQDGYLILRGLCRVYEAILSTSSTTNRESVIQKLESIYLEILKLRPRDVGTLNNLAYLYADKMSKPEEGMKYIRQALMLKPGNPRFLDTKAWILAKMGKFEESKALLEDILELLQRTRQLDSSGEVLYHMGFVSEKTGDKTEALGYYRQAEAAVSPEDPLLNEVRQSIRRLQETR